MSYILDALRRAEAERERGHVPGLHTQPLASSAAPATATRLPQALPWGGGLVVLLLAVLAAGGWWLLVRPAAPEPVLAQAPVAAPPVVPMPAARPAPPVNVAPAEAVQVVPVSPALRPAAVASAPAIVPWERLPDSQRRALPALAISGAIWSESAANRMLIVSGQLLHEGDLAAPGVTLEQIRPKSAVLRWKDLRYEVSF